MKDLKNKAARPFLIVGLFASMIFIVNCDKSTSRSIKAAMPTQKLDTNSLPPCTADVMTLVNSRKQLFDELNKKYNEYKNLDLDQAKKNELNVMTDTLKNKSNEVYTAIRALKGSPKGCNSVSSDNKKSPQIIENMQIENRNLAKKVAELTGISNILANSSEEVDATTLIENQSYQLKSDLARVMTTAKVSNMYIMDGKIFDGAGAAEDLKEMKEKKNKAFCYLEASIGELTSAEQVRIIQIHSEISEDQKTASANVRWVANGDQLNSFSCIITKPSDLPTEMRKIFGDLIILKNGVGSSGDVNTGHF